MAYVYRFYAYSPRTKPYWYWRLRRLARAGAELGFAAGAAVLLSYLILRLA